MVERIKLAVYGTLKSTHSNHRILGPDAEVLAQGVRIPKMSLYNLGWFPGVIPDEDGDGVMVEIVSIPITQLQFVDGYEGYDACDPERGLFNRLPIKIGEDDVLMYTYNGNIGETSRLIPSGNWESSNGN